MYGRCPKSATKTLTEEKWFRYDEPDLRKNGNRDLADNEIVCYSEDELWEIMKAKDKFPEGLPELAANSLPSNDFIEYILKINTVFRKTIVVNKKRIKAVFLSNLSKEEVLERVFSSE